MRRPSVVANPVFIHAGALSERHANDPHEALANLHDWEEAMASDEALEKASSLESAGPLAEEEIVFSAVGAGDIVVDGFVEIEPSQPAGDVFHPTGWNSRKRPHC